ncbi:MAG TPA: hypothetical protein VLK22_01575 [Candidatus Udaeobacter sp.]|nr:hypothetical protein [Candidatus Udaeobacter sp.]
MKPRLFLLASLMILLFIGGGLFFKKFLIKQKLAKNISSATNNISTTNSISSTPAVNQNTNSSTITTINSQTREESLNDLVKLYRNLYINTIINFHPTIIVTDSTKIIKNSKYNYQLTTSFPVFSGFSNKESELFLNNKIKEIIQKETDKNIYFAKQDYEAFNADSLNLSDKSYISFNYRIYIRENGLISMQIFSGISRRTVKGGAWSIDSIVFDSVNNKEILLNDIFTKDYSIKMSEIINKYTKQDFGEAFDDGFQRFLFTKNGVLLTIDSPFTVSPLVEYIIEWKDLESVLNPEIADKLRE